MAFRYTYGYGELADVKYNGYQWFRDYVNSYKNPQEYVICFRVDGTAYLVITSYGNTLIDTYNNTKLPDQLIDVAKDFFKNLIIGNPSNPVKIRDMIYRLHSLCAIYSSILSENIITKKYLEWDRKILEEQCTEITEYDRTVSNN